MLAVTAISVIALERSARTREYAQMSRVALAAASALEQRASINASYLRAGAAVFAMQPELTEPVFRRFVRELRLDTDARGAIGIGWAPFIAGNPIGRTPVTYLEPMDPRNGPAIGYDMYSEPVRRAAMVEARLTLRPVASGRVLLKQARAEPAAGFLVYMPVFFQADGNARLGGYVYSPYDAKEFLGAATQGLDLSDMRLRFYDGGPSSNTLLGSVGGSTQAQGRRIVQEMMLVNRPMVLEVTSLHSRSLSVVSMITLLLGLAVAGLLMLVSRLLTRKLVEDQRALAWFAEQNSIRNSLTRELNHRVKNTLANVLSIVTLTRRRARTLAEFADGLDGRIRALSATHDLLTQSEWGTTPISAVVAAELAPYTRAEDGLLYMDGPPVELAPNDALSLGLALHELATNAAKYGGLSVPGGRVSIRWALVAVDLAQIDWREEGGPQVAENRPRGFGTDLIEKIVAHELRNPVELVFAPEGVRCTMKVPVRQPSDFAIRAAPRVTGH